MYSVWVLGGEILPAVTDTKGVVSTGRRKYGDLANSKFWEDNERAERDRLRDAKVYLCPAIPFYDGASVDRLGRVSLKIMLLQCGNFRLHVNRRTCARGFLALVPSLHATEAQASAAAVTRAHRTIFHRCMQHIWASFKVGRPFDDDQC